jgi:hypothetical protein
MARGSRFRHLMTDARSGIGGRDAQREQRIEQDRVHRGKAVANFDNGLPGETGVSARR